MNDAQNLAAAQTEANRLREQMHNAEWQLAHRAHALQNVTDERDAANAKSEEMAGLLLACRDALAPAGVSEVGSAWTEIATDDYDKMNALAALISATLSGKVTK